MITFEKFGKTIKIRNNDWKKLRERFDANKADWNFLMKDYRIFTACSLCNRYKTRFNSCGSCPFTAFNSDTGCIDFFKKLFKPCMFKVGFRSVNWPKRQNKLARKQLGELQKMMDKIEASQ